MQNHEAKSWSNSLGNLWTYELSPPFLLLWLLWNKIVAYIHFIDVIKNYLTGYRKSPCIPMDIQQNLTRKRHVRFLSPYIRFFLSFFLSCTLRFCVNVTVLWSYALADYLGFWPAHERSSNVHIKRLIVESLQFL